MKRLIIQSVFLSFLVLSANVWSQTIQKFTKWEDPDRLFKAEVPEGWQITATVDPNNIAMGAFLIQGFSPDKKSMFTFAHNWSCFYEYYYGNYRPGTATLESIVLPSLPGTVPQFQIEGVMATYRSANSASILPNPYTGIGMRTDQGTVGFCGVTRSGEPVYGSLSAETMFVPVSGSPGYWCLRLFMGEMSIEGVSKTKNLEIINRFVSTFEPSAQFLEAWKSGMANSVTSMRQYSEQVGRITDKYIRSKSSGSSRNSIFDDYSEMTRGGHYRTNSATGDSYYVKNDYDYHWVEPNGTIHSNNTGTPPVGIVGLSPLLRR